MPLPVPGVRVCLLQNFAAVYDVEWQKRVITLTICIGIRIRCSLTFYKLGKGIAFASTHEGFIIKYQLAAGSVEPTTDFISPHFKLR